MTSLSSTSEYYSQKYLYNSFNNGQSVWPGITSNAEVFWQFQTYTSYFASSPAIDLNGQIYLGSLDNYLFCLTSVGELKWSFRAKGSIVSSPGIIEPIMFILAHWITRFIPYMETVRYIGPTSLQDLFFPHRHILIQRH